MNLDISGFTEQLSDADLCALRTAIDKEILARAKGEGFKPGWEQDTDGKPRRAIEVSYPETEIRCP